jgi:hypothetical protein
VTPVVAATTLLDAPAALASASAVRASSSTGRPAVDTPAPVAGACSTAAPMARGDGGGGLHLSGGPPPVAPLFVLLLRRRVLGSRRGGEPLLLAQPILFTFLLPALPPPDSPFLLTRRPLLFPSQCSAGDRPGSGHRWIRPRGVHVTLC